MAESPRYYRPELDVLRLVTFLCVFFFHVYGRLGPLPSLLKYCVDAGAFGVPVFFLLSAFLTTELLERERERFGTISIRNFYIRRALRIWPLYFAAFYGFTVLERLLLHSGARGTGCFAAFSLFVGNFWISRHGWVSASVDPLWSISVEEQFYLILPWLLLHRSRWGVQAQSYALLLVCYGVLAWYAVHPVAGDNGEWTNSLVHLQFFATGMLLSVVLRGRLPSPPVIARVAALCAAALLWMVALRTFNVRSWASHATLPGAMAGWLCVLSGTVLLLLAFLGLPTEAVPASLAYLGRRTYGCYVFHAAMILMVFQGPRRLALLRPLAQIGPYSAAVVALVLTVVSAWCSYRFFEAPLLRFKQRFTSISSGSGA